MPGKRRGIEGLAKVQQVHVRIVEACADKAVIEVDQGVAFTGQAEQLFGIAHLQKMIAFHCEGLLKGELSGIDASVVKDGFHDTACSFFVTGAFCLRCSELYRPFFSLSIRYTVFSRVQSRDDSWITNKYVYCCETPPVFAEYLVGISNCVLSFNVVKYTCD